MGPGIGILLAHLRQVESDRSNPSLTSSQRGNVGQDYRPFGSQKAMDRFQDNFKPASGAESTFKDLGNGKSGASTFQPGETGKSNVSQFKGTNTTDITPGQSKNAVVKQGGFGNTANVDGGKGASSAFIHQGNGDSATNNATSSATNNAFIQRGSSNTAKNDGVQGQFWQGGLKTAENGGVVKNNYEGSNNKFGFDAGTQVGTDNKFKGGAGANAGRQHAYEGGKNDFDGSKSTKNSDITQSGDKAKNTATFADNAGAKNDYTGMGKGSDFNVKGGAGSENVDLTKAEKSTGSIDTGKGDDTVNLDKTNSGSKDKGLDVNLGGDKGDTANFKGDFKDYDVTAGKDGSFNFKDKGAGADDKGTTIRGGQNFNFGSGANKEGMSADQLRERTGGGAPPGGPAPPQGPQNQDQPQC
jgi:hypothetical protein